MTPVSNPRLASLLSAEPSERAQALLPFEPWLRVLARLGVEDRFRAKFDPSDVVQQTLLEACRDLSKFQGQTEPELMAWLRAILAHVLAHEVRRYSGTQGRDLSREVSLDQSLDASSRRLAHLLASPGTSPSARARRHEEELQLARALDRLPDDLRQVILLRNVQGLAHDEIARLMNRSPGACRMLWVRALSRLRRELQPPADPP